MEQILQEELDNLQLEIKEVSKKKTDLETQRGFIKLQLDRIKNKTQL